MPRKKRVKQEDKYGKQLKWILIFMGIALLALVLGYFIVKSGSKFEYAGLSFEKMMYDKLVLYHAKISIKDSNGNLIANYNMYLKNDPRTLSNIPINGILRFTANSVISIDESIEGCSDNGVAGANLGSFFKDAGINITYAYTNKTVAKEKGAVYATCNDSAKQTVIIIQQTNSTEINQESNNCYVISFKDCEINKAVERFMVGVYANSRGIII